MSTNSRLDTETVEYNDITITVGAASILMGMQRSIAKGEAFRASSEGEIEPARRVLAIVTYPDLLASVVETDGISWPLDFEAFLELPEVLVTRWEEAAYRLNPHWLPGYDEEAAEDAEKKE